MSNKSLEYVGYSGSNLNLFTAQTTPMFSPLRNGFGVENNQSNFFPLTRYFKVRYTTGKAVELPANDPSIPKEGLLTNTTQFYFIVSRRRVPTTLTTIETINDSSKSKNYLAKFGIEYLQQKALEKKKDEGFLPDFFETFSKAMFDHAIGRNTSDPDRAVKDVNEVYGVKVNDAPDVVPVYFIYDSIVNGYDKVQHFISSAYRQYCYGKQPTDIAQYAKEIGDELWGTGFDGADMYANNRGQVYGQGLYKKYHPLRNVLR